MHYPKEIQCSSCKAWFNLLWRHIRSRNPLCPSCELEYPPL